MTKTVDFLLVGGGLSCAFSADTLRKEGANGKITILSEESFLPYLRPQLARGFLSGARKKEHMVLFDEDYYKRNEIEVLLNTKVLSVDTEKRESKPIMLETYTLTNCLLPPVAALKGSIYQEAN